jgi:hypothetical protein
MTDMARYNFLLLVCIISACSTTYHDAGLSGGFHEKNIEGNIWHARYAGNGYTYRETIQTYWLYRCTELTLEQGYDGFEIVSPVDIADITPLKRWHGHVNGFHKTANTNIPTIIPDNAYKPEIDAEIRLLRRPFTPDPPNVFDAASLKAALDPYVNGEKCEQGNVCPHIHWYLCPQHKPERTRRGPVHESI